MSFRPFLRPGQGFQPFTVLRREYGLTENSRPTTSSLKPQGKIHGIITRSAPTETDQHKQLGSPVSYTILQRGTQNAAKANDILESQDGRRFLVKGDPRNPGGLGRFLSYKCEERDDLYERNQNRRPV